jgi:hypothetical protein
MSDTRGYLDGVPFRLNSKFYPQPRPQFKEIDIHIPVDALQDDVRKFVIFFLKAL